MEDKKLEKPEAAEETAVQPETSKNLAGRAGEREKGCLPRKKLRKEGSSL